MSVLESVLLRNPNHLGANHYYIHAVEASRTPARALPSAQRLTTLSESSGHLLHMPAHIYARTGDHAAAAKANADGAAADRRYIVTAPPNGMYGMMYYPHNLHFLVDSHMMQGRFADATAGGGSRRRAVGPARRDDADGRVDGRDAGLCPAPVLETRRSARAAASARGAHSPACVASLRARHRTREDRKGGGSGGREKAARYSNRSGAGDRGVRRRWMGDGGERARVASSALDARIATARGEHDRAIKFWQQAVAAADQLPYDEPPVWFYPVRESLGASLLAAGRAADAERVFRDDLVKHPRNARSLFGLQAALTKQGKDADAAWVQREFNEAWKNADTKLTLEDF